MVERDHTASHILRTSDDARHVSARNVHFSREMCAIPMAYVHYALGICGICVGKPSRMAPEWTNA